MRYIEVVGSVTAWSLKLTLWDRCMIGKFTRENVEMWLANHVGLDPGFYPEDFHAVCGDIEIPWATKEGHDCYQRVMKLAEARRGERLFQVSKKGHDGHEDTGGWSGRFPKRGGLQSRRQGG